jgi:hypothetical protein
MPRTLVLLKSEVRRGELFRSGHHDWALKVPTASDGKPFPMDLQRDQHESQCAMRTTHTC